MFYFPPPSRCNFASSAFHCPTFTDHFSDQMDLTVDNQVGSLRIILKPLKS